LALVRGNVPHDRARWNMPALLLAYAGISGIIEKTVAIVGRFWAFSGSLVVFWVHAELFWQFSAVRCWDNGQQNWAYFRIIRA
jgi:hypothetical protein